MVWLQQHMGTVGLYLAIFFTNFGEEAFLIILLGLLYWGIDKKRAAYIGEVAVLSIVLNPMLKNIALRRRPYFDHKEIQCLKPVHKESNIYNIAVQGFSFPSGHSTSSAAIFGSMAVCAKKTITRVVLIVLAFLVGLSRIALGVHYPTDVLVGLVLGFAVIGIVTLARKYIRNQHVMHLLFFVVLLPGFAYCKTTDYYTAMGCAAGFFAALWFEEKFVNFENTRSIPKMILRVIGGLIVYLVLNQLLKLPFSSEFLSSATLLSYLVRFARYTINIFVMFGVYPLLFDRFPKRGE